MKNASNVIEDIKSLPQNEQEKVINFVVSIVDQKEMSEDVVQQLLQARKDDEQGINMSPAYKTKDEALRHLDRLSQGTTTA